ncbi:ACT domain-containing protein [Nocardioides sp.]|uniref:ACT domain-containing protein n=1 Tax=Nocardioides sp. TaxID=35761 RepID=UPI002B7B72BB|nr:ACT domain-containing protein [Nocardioides sp.]HSX69075.1 ACT domain-containing protein [Nocardioides sp.]
MSTETPTDGTVDDVLDLDAVASAIPAWQSQTFTLAEYPEKLAIVKLAPGAEVPQWAESSSIFSVTATATETSLICAGRSVPTKTPSIKPLIAFRITGEIDPGAVGVLANLLVPLAEIGVPAYTFSTYETDWVMVRVIDSEKAAEEWRRRGHTVAAAVPITPQKSSPKGPKKK